MWYDERKVMIEALSQTKSFEITLEDKKDDDYWIKTTIETVSRWKEDKDLFTEMRALVTKRLKEKALGLSYNFTQKTIKVDTSKYKFKQFNEYEINLIYGIRRFVHDAIFEADKEYFNAAIKVGAEREKKRQEELKKFEKDLKSVQRKRLKRLESKVQQGFDF